MKVLIVGDTHGFAHWLRDYTFPVAMTVGAEAIVVLGDFGAWEHTPAGVTFMDEVNDMAFASGIPLYWLHGNHDKFSHTLAAYSHKTSLYGFLACRDRVFYIPQGQSWSWGGVTFRAFGGAYSIDKQWRLEEEERRRRALVSKAFHRSQSTGRQMQAVASSTATLWFPEEEMTDTEMAELLAVDSGPKDIVLSHDKPYSARPPWNRKDLPGCVPNQLRLERALRAHRPAYWVHGHLHYHYTQPVNGDGFTTTVIGLEPDRNAAEPGWREANTWLLADCTAGQLDVRLGNTVHLDRDTMQQAMQTLG